MGRALRRQSYELSDDNLFPVEYADVLGIPFDFTAKPVVAKPLPPRSTVQVKAVTPRRERCETRFPRVQGYRVELPKGIPASAPMSRTTALDSRCPIDSAARPGPTHPRLHRAGRRRSG